MAPYNYNNGTYYDPVGSQAHHPQSYTYQQPSTSTVTYPGLSTSTQQSTNYSGYGGNYANQQYAPEAHSSAQGSYRTAAAALSSLGSQDYGQSRVAERNSGNNAGAYDNTSWGSSSYGTNAYNTESNLQMPARTQNNTSPLYATQAASGTYAAQNGQATTQGGSTGYSAHNYSTAPSASVTRQYQSAYSQSAQAQQAQQPQRYNSPLHAIQSQQQNQRGHSQQPSRGSALQPSPRMTAHSSQQLNNRQQSASVEPSPATVDPSQVYDWRAEQQRKAQIEAEKKRKKDEEEAARKAEEEREAAEKRRQEEEKQKMLEAEKMAAEKKAVYERKGAERRKALEEKRQSKSAATALQRMASGAVDRPSVGASVTPHHSAPAPASASAPVPVSTAAANPPLNDEEAEMRAMFQKMREFNAKNPAMLAKLWEEERRSHNSQSPQASKPTPPTAASQLPAPQQKVADIENTSFVNAGTSQPYRPFQKPSPPKAAAKVKAAAPRASLQTSTASNKPTTSLWPPHKKGALAEAAALWLTSLPGNVGKSVRTEEILKVLDSNPSYVQLCEALESLALKFERSQLARELLKKVPDGMKSQTATGRDATPLSTISGTAPQSNGAAVEGLKKRRGRPPKMQSPPSSGGTAPNLSTVSYEAPAFASLIDAAREVNKMGKVPAAMIGGPVQPPQMTLPLTSPSAIPNDARPPTPSEQKPKIHAEEPPRPPANKEEAARKRTFTDLVDLTADDSDDERPPKKASNVPASFVNGVQAQDKEVFRNNFRGPMSFQEFVGQRATQGMLGGQGAIHPSAPPAAKMLPPPRPGMSNGINQHGSASSSTLPPPPKPSKPKGPTAEQLQHERVKGKMLVEPIMRDRVARKSKYDSRTIARDVLLATGRHPDMRALNAHMNNMHKLLGDHGGSYETDGSKGNRSDLSTIRWDIIDPDPEPVPRMPEALEAEKVVTSVGGGQDFGDADDEDGDSAPFDMHVRHEVVDNGDGTSSYVPVMRRVRGKDIGPRKRRVGAARISLPDNIAISAMDSGGDDKTALNLRGSGTPARQVTDASAPYSAPPAAGGSGPVGYSAFRRLDENGNVIKTKGRPKGWKKSIHSREAQGLAPAKAYPSSGPRGPRRPIQAKGSALQEPHYQVYKCGWQDCAAELHNLETLKKHVIKIHGRKNGDDLYDCLWQGCSALPADAGKGKQRVDDVDNPMEFEAMEEWILHVDSTHLQPVAWRLGDGPRGGILDLTETDGSEAYLSDAQGRSVTPIIRVPSDIPDATSQVMPRPVPGLTSSGYLPPEGAHLTKEEKEAVADLQELEQHKRAVGITMEKEGCTLANKTRRMGFLDDEDFEDTIEDSDVEIF